MKTKLIGLENKVSKLLKKCIDRLFNKRDDDDNFFNNPYAVL
jgi:hypothetical protein